ncbi:MAG TPA: type II secretion system protein [Candidatus Paceibacterota bacterium]|nr:type II secretion system protein [Candidatus Paceibacterota bacterium]
MQQKQKGFTLIELLIVVSIIAILAVFVILTLNPAQMLAQARDSQRLSDMSTLKSAISLYLQDVSSPNIGNANYCYGSSPNTSTTVGCGRMAATDVTISTTSVASSSNVSGGGWIPVNFSTIGSGSPIGSEPVDPINNATYFYSYATNDSPNFQFEIDTKMESTKYAASGTSDVESTDGGSNPNMYEVGTSLTL